MAVAISETVTMPVMIPIIESPERSLFARMADHEMRKPSLNSLSNVTGRGVNRSCSHRFPASPDDFVAGNEAIADSQNAPRVPGDLFFMGHDNDGIALARKFLE